MGAPAGAFLVIEHANVARAIAQQRERIFCDAGKDQFADAAFGKHFAGFGVDDLRDKVIFVDVHAVLVAAFKGDAGTGDLRKSVDVIRRDAELLFNIPPHLFGPGLRTENARLELDLILQAPFANAFRKIGSIRGGAAEDGGAEIAHELDLPVGIAGGHR